MPDGLVTIASFPTAAEASPVLANLESAGVRAYLQGGNTADTLWHVGTAIGGVQLQVAAADVAKAREFLGWRDEAGAEHPPAWTCGGCGEQVDAGFAVCWNCGTAWDENPPPQPKAEEPSPAADEPGFDCPMCGERLPEDTEECRHCGEQLDAALAWQSRFASSDVGAGEEPEYQQRARAVLNRALRASVLGLILCPPLTNIYSMLLLAEYQQLRRDYQLDRDWRLVAAYVFNALSLAPALAGFSLGVYLGVVGVE